MTLLLIEIFKNKLDSFSTYIMKYYILNFEKIVSINEKKSAQLHTNKLCIYLK